MAETHRQAARRRIREKAAARAHAIADLIVQEIRLNPRTPVSKPGERHDQQPPGELRESYYVDTDKVTGDALIKSHARYWQFVEYGTLEHGHAQPHVRPAIRLVKQLLR